MSEWVGEVHCSQYTLTPEQIADITTGAVAAEGGSHHQPSREDLTLL